MTDPKYFCVIFDFGNVLVHFKEEILTAPYFAPEDRAEAGRVIFDRGIWDRLDAGTIEESEVHEYITANLPERLQAAAHRCFDEWPDNLPEVDGMKDVVLGLKARGIPVFVLSNISRRFAAIAHENPVIARTDGQVYSSVCGMVKPDPAIFRYAARQFGFRPEECLFADDLAKNTAGARAAGMGAWDFRGCTPEFLEFLKEHVIARS